MTRREGQNQSLARLVRVGIVMEADNRKRVARVKYQDTGAQSGWLRVPACRTYTSYEPDPGGPLPWMPKINAVVLVLCQPVPEGDGFILGELGPLDRILQ